jgi:hypothetical protein
MKSVISWLKRSFIGRRLGRTGRAWLGYRGRCVYIRVRSGRPGRRILCFPDLPRTYHKIFFICQELGYVLTADTGRPADLVLHWKDTTYREVPEVLAGMDGRVLNLHCNDISKVHLERVFRSVFGYGSIIDPLKHEGVCIRKSNLNAQHRNSLVRCPLSQRDSGFVYQKFIDSFEGVLSEEIRVPLFDGTVPFLVLKYRTREQQFMQEKTRMLHAAVSDHLSSDELSKVLEFCRLFRLDYGELDLLRDRHDGRLYIIDANNTPGGTTDGLTRELKRENIKLYADGFRKMMEGGGRKK